ncbi:uncharacterized protein LOC143219696 [Lasioglossum baleicum]|uniref:uncharacterized protein LOC143219696 n=1 Tax=Lasioglossum baleicum TaxID=434251 RepID=UPI003FCE87A2
MAPRTYVLQPADCASRGLIGQELRDHPLWWTGPQWLRWPQHCWSSDPPAPTDEPLSEARSAAVHTCSQTSPWTLASRFSSWAKLIRITAYIFKFIHALRARKNTSSPISSNGSTVSVDECSEARIFWIKSIQREQFPTELEALTHGRSVSTKSSIISLNPFIDSDGVLRVGGRLHKAQIPVAQKHPVLLASHSLVDLIISQAHLRTLHGGLQLALSTLRREFWILSARSLVKRVIHRCVICVRERAKIPEQLMSSLPAARVNSPPRCFSHCGVDYAGPIQVRASAGRGIKARKAYIALFICLASRAIHLELVGDYSTAAFLNAFDRFCSRRGLPSDMYSDNGTTFTGANNELARAYRAALRDPNFQNKSAHDKISWHFIPPVAPHFGGLWEAGVPSVKHHLRRVLGDPMLSFEEFTTLLCRIEACVNSRPIAPLSDALDDCEPLTPGHFLIGSALTTSPEPSVLHLNENRLSRWQLVRHKIEHFWRLWQSDYVNTLQQRSRWRQTRTPLELGQLVLIRHPTAPPCKWKLGRVTRLHPGSDGLTRVVTVRTAQSEFQRPIVQLCALPCCQCNNNNEDEIQLSIPRRDISESPATPTLESSMREIYENPKTHEEEAQQLSGNLGPLARQYLQKFFTGPPKHSDTVYGVYVSDNGTLMLGNATFDVTGNDDIIINGEKYMGTPGLYELIFSKIPDDKLFTEAQIRPLFLMRSGKGLPTSMKVTNNPIDYMHWDDPNELVDRLKLLVSSKNAGHTGHNNEIISIIEELLCLNDDNLYDAKGIRICCIGVPLENTDAVKKLVTD